MPFLSPWSGPSEAFSSLLDGGLRRVAPQMELWSFERVFSQVPEAELKLLFNGSDTHANVLSRTVTVRRGLGLEGDG